MGDRRDSRLRQCLGQHPRDTFPVLTLVLALVLAVGSVESLRTRIGAQVDMAALTATQALDLYPGDGVRW